MPSTRLRPFLNAFSTRTLVLAAGAAVLLVGAGQATENAIDWGVHADAQTVVILHADEDGTARETTIWLCVSNGQGYVRGGGGRWVGNALRNGEVAVRIGEVELAVHATKLTDETDIDRVTAAFRAKYGFGDVLATLVRGRPTIFRLEAR